MKLLMPDSGKIILGGLDYKKIESKIIRKRIGYVSQDLNLFKGTIRENITFWDQRLWMMKKSSKV